MTELTSLFQRIFGTTVLGLLYLYGSVMEREWWSIVLYGPFLVLLGALTMARNVKKGRELQKYMKWSRLEIDGQEFLVLEFQRVPQEKENGKVED